MITLKGHSHTCTSIMLIHNFDRHQVTVLTKVWEAVEEKNLAPLKMHSKYISIKRFPDHMLQFIFNNMTNHTNVHINKY